jgi:hypothetical protein
MFCGFMTTGEQVIFSADGNRSDTIFHRIIVDIQSAVGGVNSQFVPSF